MIARPAYPADTATGSCFLTGDYNPANGVVDLERYLDALPPYGRLCVSGIAVRDMVTALGLAWPDEDVAASNTRLIADNAKLRAENQQMRAAVANILAASKLAKLDTWADELEHAR